MVGETSRRDYPVGTKFTSCEKSFQKVGSPKPEKKHHRKKEIVACADYIHVCIICAGRWLKMKLMLSGGGDEVGKNWTEVEIKYAE